jgi:hypothetical protein
MTGSARTRFPHRARNLVVVAVLGLILGTALFLGYGVITAPRPRDAPGWEQLPGAMPAPRGETAVAVAGATLYEDGGLTGIGIESTAELSSLNADTLTWVTGPPLPEPRHHAAAAAVRNDIFLSGGAASIADGGPRSEVWALNTMTFEWTPVAPMPIARLGHRMVAIDGILYVVGGVSGASPPGASVEPGAVLIYDALAATWTTGAALPQPRDHLAVVVVDGEIWAIGGRTAAGNVARVDIYDPGTDMWRDGPPLPEPTSGAAEAAIGSRILVSGGEDPGRGTMVDRHWILDTADVTSDSWVELAPPPLTVHGVPGAALRGSFVIAGGSARAGGQSNTAWTGLTQRLIELP